MNAAKAGLGSAVLAAALALATVQASHAFSVPSTLRLSAPGITGTAILTRNVKAAKKVKSCNKGDDRKGHHNAAVNAWAVACEFPPRSEPNMQGLTNAAAAAISALGG
jgi:hypothetical protein